MTQSFKLPDLGEGIHEGEVVAVTVSVGDRVEEGDIILEIETDKAAVEIPSPVTGIVAEIRVKVGDVVKVDDVLMTFDTAAASETEEPEASRKRDASSGTKPSKKSEADEQNAEDPDKPRREEKEDKAADKKDEGIPRDRKRPVPASPATRRLARELGVDLHEVTSTGRGGVVTAEDVRGHAEAGGPAAREREKDEKTHEKPESAPDRSETPEQPRPLATEAPDLPDFSRWGEVERIPVRSIRRATARQMALSWSRIPHVTTTDRVDITDLEAFRRKHREKIADQGGHLSLTVFVLKALVSALKRFPYFNSSLDATSGELILKRYYHIGVAVDTEDGLIVPVLRDVDRKSLSQIAVELKALVEKTRNRKVAVEELQGGTFTVTNTGGAGGQLFVPIVNHPQAAILGMGRAALDPVVRTLTSGRHEIVPRFMMPIILTMDHRILDGGDASRFLAAVTGALADPEELFLTG